MVEIFCRDQQLLPVEVEALYPSHNVVPGGRIIEVSLQNILPCGCRGLAVDEGCIGPSAAVWPPRSVCAGCCELTREARNVAIIRAVVSKIVGKRVYGRLSVCVCVCVCV